MKKILLLSAFALLLASCKLDNSYEIRRTDYNLANFNMQLESITAASAVYVLTNIDDAVKDTILRAGYDSVFVAYADNYYGSVRATSEMQLTLSSPVDSTWNFVSTATDPNLQFSGSLRMTGRSSAGHPIFSGSWNGTYKEKDGYTADFGSDGNVVFYWERNAYQSYYGSSNLYYTLNRDGKIKMTTWYDGKKLDESTVTFKGTDYSF